MIQADAKSTLLVQIDARHDELLRELEQLNQRIEDVLSTLARRVETPRMETTRWPGQRTE